MDKKKNMAAEILMGEYFTQKVMDDIKNKQLKPKSFIEVNRKLLIKVYACAAVIIVAILYTGVFDTLCTYVKTVDSKITLAVVEINNTDIKNIFEGGKLND